MNRWFNVAGPCRPEIHYMLPPLARLPELDRLIAQQSYFVLHAPRQTGKTTAMWALAQQLTASGKWTAVVLSVEVGSAFNQEPGKAEAAILSSWRNAIRHRLPSDLHPPAWPPAPEGQQIGAALSAWAHMSTRPLVLLIDEIDALQDTTLISVLRQLRTGYNDRPTAFPHALALIGMRDVRDYKVAAGGSGRLGTARPFNIKTRSLTLGNFTAEDVATLYAQHTADTGQPFTPEAVAEAFRLTQGQPWLVNALAKVVVEELATDSATPITPALITAATDVLIERQDTHLDSLAERLREPRVRAVVEPLLAGLLPPTLPSDDIQFVLDLGLVRMDAQQGLELANPIYAAVLPRTLTFTTRAFFPPLNPTWLNASGQFDPEGLLAAFLSFWRQHGQPLLGTTSYHEIAPHLVLMAFLDRVANGGGRVEREYAVGRGRLDLRLELRGIMLAIEVKVWRSGAADPLAEGLAQLDGYLAGLGLTTGWLVIFDQRPDLPPIAERTSAMPATTPSGRQITLVRG
ncbi:ATP-binding protein [Candidatus Viridilinea mediisalina]|uniref:Polyketide biosynthesis operon protein CyrO n=1 Tax=Candidatus Viridilinea mediisalina TaxID=2024553 RepID=A0A2A6RMF4_9CHLR|nr:ATP-binding protein [Candidatus Viridilinea mediisalina]PDW04274.1 polyketide biosynthesis operon protein CyrO [Candidatus Viridilinea mediisalina]